MFATLGKMGNRESSTNRSCSLLRAPSRRDLGGSCVFPETNQNNPNSPTTAMPIPANHIGLAVALLPTFLIHTVAAH